MYIVIFKAKISELNEEYEKSAVELRELAKLKYGCTDFVSLTDGDVEITLSYWESLDDIKRWKDDPVHQGAQKTGKRKYYQEYTVQIARIEKQYGFSQ